MIETVKIKKGLDIPLGGTPERHIVDARSIERYAVKPPDVVGFTPRLLVAEGDSVNAGQPLVADKNSPRLTLPSPVDGVVKAIVRGVKRRLLEVVVEKDLKGPKDLKDPKDLRAFKVFTVRCHLVKLSGLNPVFTGLSLSRGKVGYALLTRAPVAIRISKLIPCCPSTCMC